MRGLEVDTSELVPLTPSSRKHGSESTAHAGLPSSNSQRGARRGPISRSSSSTPQNWEPRREPYPSTGSDLPNTRSRQYVRVRKLSELEEEHQQKLSGKNGLKDWPKFFKKPEDAGNELVDAHGSIWSTFIIVETLLISIAILPFITSIPNLDGWRVEAYGLLWMLVMSVTCFFLGYLHAHPSKLTYMYVCNVGSWDVLPSFLVLFCATVSMVAIAFSSWVIYGRKVGIVCISFEVFVVLCSIFIAYILNKASKAVEALESGAVDDRMDIIEHEVIQLPRPTIQDRRLM